VKPSLKTVVPLKRSPREAPILAIEDLRKVFHVNGSFTTVLDSVAFQAARGEMICILGRSGCGKTTLLKILAGFVPPSSGQILLDGRAVSRPGPDRCVVFQEDALFPWLTVGENIAFGLKQGKRSREVVRKETDRFLSLVGLGEFRDYLPGEISGGMKQRVALARVLVLQPRVLLMDEPFAALDAQTRHEMQELLLSLWRKLSHTVIFVTHDVNEAVTLADRILVMSRHPGRIREEIPVDLPRPRRPDDEAFIGLSRRLYAALKD